MKAFNGVQYNKVTPVIKDLAEDLVKLAPLDLGKNDYIGEFISRINQMKEEIDEAMTSLQNPS